MLIKKKKIRVEDLFSNISYKFVDCVFTGSGSISGSTFDGCTFKCGVLCLEESEVVNCDFKEGDFSATSVRFWDSSGVKVIFKVKNCYFSDCSLLACLVKPEGKQQLSILVGCKGVQIEGEGIFSTEHHIAPVPAGEGRPVQRNSTTLQERIKSGERKFSEETFNRRQDLTDLDLHNISFEKCVFTGLTMERCNADSLSFKGCSLFNQGLKIKGSYLQDFHVSDTERGVVYIENSSILRGYFGSYFHSRGSAFLNCVAESEGIGFVGNNIFTGGKLNLQHISVDGDVTFAKARVKPGARFYGTNRATLVECSGNFKADCESVSFHRLEPTRRSFLDRLSKSLTQVFH